MLLTVDQINNILSFWFPNNTFNKFWFDKNIEIDTFIFTNYKNLMNNIYDKITINLLEELEYNELLSIIILFDQFSRNINRIESVDINKFTIMAKEISLLLIKKDIYNNSMNHITFILMPLRHLNIKEDYILILDILDKLKNKDCVIFNKFKNQTIKRFNLFY
jgi:uncharacterized protein (DUF924 family)